MRRVAVGPVVLEFRADDPLARRVVESLYHAATPTDATAARHYRLARDRNAWVGFAPMRPPFGPARLEDVFAFLEWRATEDLLATPGAVFLHAAGLRVADRNVLLIGASGAGKSTLAAHLFVRGHRLWGDDLVRFAPREARFSAVPRSMKLDAKSLPSLYLISALCRRAAQGTLLASDTLYVSPAAFRRGWQAPDGRADVVVLLDAAHAGPPRVERIGEGQAALAAARMLMGSGAIGSAQEQARVMATVVEAMSELTAFRAAGTPPEAVASALEQVLAA